MKAETNRSKETNKTKKKTGQLPYSEGSKTRQQFPNYTIYISIIIKKLISLNWESFADICSFSPPRKDRMVWHRS
jgi:hypothetical protein